MTSWRDAVERFNNEQAEKEQHAADERNRRAREDAKRLAEVDKADGLVKDFLRNARSVGNPGVKHDSYEEVGWLVKKRIPKGVGYWSGGRDLMVRVDGIWQYGWVLVDNYNGTDPTGIKIGRSTEGLYCNYASGDLGREIDNLQRALIVLMREHGIPIPS